MHKALKPIKERYEKQERLPLPVCHLARPPSALPVAHAGDSLHQFGAALRAAPSQEHPCCWPRSWSLCQALAGQHGLLLLLQVCRFLPLFPFRFPMQPDSLDTSDTPQPESPAASEAPQTPKLQAWMRLGAHTKHKNSSTLRPTASDLQQQASSCLQWGAAQRASRGTPAGTQPLAAPGTAQGSPARRVPTARLLSAFQILPDDNLDV